MKLNTLFACTILLLSGYSSIATDTRPGDEAGKKKLKVVLLMGQSNMVGMCETQTPCYLRQPMFVPPKEVFLTPPPREAEATTTMAYT